MTYKDPGYTANDPDEGDITDNVVVTYKKKVNGVFVDVILIDDTVDGEYKTHYKVTDAGGLSAERNREVFISPILNVVPSKTAFLFTGTINLTMLDGYTGNHISTIFDPANFELRYKADGSLIASGTDVFSFNISGSLTERELVFIVDKGLATEQISEFSLIHYPDEKVHYGSIGGPFISYRVFEASVHKNDIPNGIAEEDFYDWGPIKNGIIVFNYLLSNNGHVNIYDDGVLTHTIDNPVINKEYFIPSLNTEKVSVEHIHVHYGHKQVSKKKFPVAASNVVINVARYGGVGGADISGYKVVNQTLDKVPIEEQVTYSSIGGASITGHKVVNQTLSRSDFSDQVSYSHIGGGSINSYLVLQQSNTEVN